MQCDVYTGLAVHLQWNLSDTANPRNRWP